MYADADAQLERILAITEKCPEPYRGRCFEILLQGYVDAAVAGPRGGARGSESANGSGPRAGGAADDPAPRGGAEAGGDGGVAQLPAELRGRFQTMAKRLGVAAPALEGVFDLSAEPLDYHALHVVGDGNAERTRKVALLVAARSYLLTGAWVADWQEVKAKSVDQNCYDPTNFASYLKKGAPSVFKPVTPKERVELNGAGIKEAQALLAALATEGL